MTEAELLAEIHRLMALSNKLSDDTRINLYKALAERHMNEYDKLVEKKLRNRT